MLRGCTSVQSYWGLTASTNQFWNSCMQTANKKNVHNESAMANRSHKRNNANPIESQVNRNCITTAKQNKNTHFIISDCWKIIKWINDFCVFFSQPQPLFSLPICSILMLSYMEPQIFCMLPDLLAFDKLIEFRTDALHVLIYNVARDVCAMNYGHSFKFMLFTSLLSRFAVVCLGAGIKIFIIV